MNACEHGRICSNARTADRRRKASEAAAVVAGVPAAAFCRPAPSSEYLASHPGAPSAAARGVGQNGMLPAAEYREGQASCRSALSVRVMRFAASTLQTARRSLRPARRRGPSLRSLPLAKRGPAAVRPPNATRGSANLFRRPRDLNHGQRLFAGGSSLPDGLASLHSGQKNLPPHTHESAKPNQVDQFDPHRVCQKIARPILRGLGGFA